MSKATDLWFVKKVLPLEAGLTRYLRRNWANAAEIEDLRQEVYVRAYEAARKAMPLNTKPFVYAIARNLLIDRVRRSRVVVIDAIADLDALNVSAEEALPDREVSAREELRQTQTAIELLPPRCRAVLVMRRIEQMPQKEVARRLGIKEDTVEKQLGIATRRLAAMLFAKEEAAPLNSTAEDDAGEEGEGDAKRR